MEKTEQLTKQIEALESQVKKLNKQVEHIINNGAIPRLTSKNFLNNIWFGFARGIGTTLLFALVVYIVNFLLERLGKVPFFSIFVGDPKIQELLQQLLKQSQP
ncbi:MAG: hypothetical protein Fur003_4600 [Candidatus Dojkabacteria bacterium]